MSEFFADLLADILGFIWAHGANLGVLGAFIPFWSNLEPGRSTRFTRLLGLLALLAIAPMVSAVGLFLVLTQWLQQPSAPTLGEFEAYLARFIPSVLTAVLWFRIVVPAFNSLTARLTRRTDLERNRKTDVREISKFLPAQVAAYDPRKFVRKTPTSQILIGLDEHRKPVAIAYDEFCIRHILLAGGTRSGKGVAAQILIPQALQRGEFVVVLDPKGDDWMPHGFKVACEQVGVPYHYLDLRQSQPAQCNPFSGCNAETLEGMLIGGFGLSEKGEAADFYRLADRKAARQCAVWLAGHQSATARDALAALGADWIEAAPAFHSYLSEIAALDSVNAISGGLDVASGERTGGMLYVVGDMIHPGIIRMQRMVLLRLLYLAKNRRYLGKTPRKILVFADEFKVHISRPFMTSLGASAGWGLHCILAFQSMQDLADCPQDLSPEVVKGSVSENCTIKLSYRVDDPDTAEWLSRSTGTVLVDDESRTVEKNVGLAETVHPVRRISQAERALVDTNMFTNLPKGCGVLRVPGSLARFVYTSPVPTERSDAAITPTAAQASVFPTAGAAAIDMAQPILQTAVDPLL